MSVLHASRTVHVFFLNATATTEIYTLSLHDALPISNWKLRNSCRKRCSGTGNASPDLPQLRMQIVMKQALTCERAHWQGSHRIRSEEHTSELQSRENLVCRLLLEKKNKKDRKTEKC